MRSAKELIQRQLSHNLRQLTGTSCIKHYDMTLFEQHHVCKTEICYNKRQNDILIKSLKKIKTEE